MTASGIRRFLFFTLAALAATGLVTPPIALALGLALALTFGNPYPARAGRVARILLQASVVGLGFGMNLAAVWEAGRTGFGFTVATILGALALGLLLGRLLRVDRQTSLLVSVGTAICGGSAIAAVGSVIDADDRAISVSLGTVFLLNAVALFLFPPLGNWLGLGPEQFGVWSAIAIHDTSSVVGAAARHGDAALQTATTVKLVRALWILPLALGISLVRGGNGGRPAYPWFILLFLGAAALRTAWPGGVSAYGAIVSAAKLGLTLTLFLIGCGLSRAALREVGLRPMAQGLLLWAVVAVGGLLAVRGWLG